MLFAIGATAFLGMAGLATQAGLWYADYADLQTAADSASMAGAVAIAASETTTQATASATYVLKQNGYLNNQGGVTVTVHTPPTSGTFKNNAHAVEVVLAKTASLNVAGLFMASAPTFSVRSVAVYGANAATCMLALGQDLGGSNNGHFALSGGASIHASGCTLATNSTSTEAFYIEPSPQITADTIVSSGGVTSSCGQGPTGCGSTLTLNQPYSSYHVPSTDPLAAVQNVTLPSSSDFSPASSCSGTPQTVSFPQWNSTASMQSGCYAALTVPGTNTISFPSGGGSYTFTGDVNLGGVSSISGGASAVTAASTISISGALNLTNYNASQLPPGTYYIGNGMNISSSAATSVAYSNIPSTFYINGNLTLSGSAQVDIPPGTYFINDGNLNVGNGTTLSCSSCVAGGAGVTFVLMGDHPGIVNVSGSAPVTFSAPASSNYDSGFDGIAIYEVPGDSGTNLLQGSGTLNVQGAIYLPGAALSISGGAGSSVTCAVFVANTITMSGSGYATDNSCGQYGYGWATAGPTPNGVTLAE